MNRRDFMRGILATCAAPAIVRAESLMPVNSRILIPRRDILLTGPSFLFLDNSGRILARCPIDIETGLLRSSIIEQCGLATSFEIRKDGKWLCRGTVGGPWSGSDFLMQSRAMNSGSVVDGAIETADPFLWKLLRKSCE